MARVFGKTYDINIQYKRKEPPAAPRLVVVGFQPNDTAREILRLCLDSIRYFTPEPHELWVVDNYSPPEMSAWLKNEPGLNVIFNRTPPTLKRRGLDKIFKTKTPPYAGSYANSVALELAAQIIDPHSQVMMSLHMDTMATCRGWLNFLRDHLNQKTRAVGVRMDTSRVRALHVLGLMFDFSLFHKMKLSFQHDMPRYDCGDRISIDLEAAGYKLWAASNSLWQPEIVDRLPKGSPYREISVDRSVKENGEVFFMHMGRGVEKSVGGSRPGKTTADEWLRFGRQVVLKT